MVAVETEHAEDAGLAMFLSVICPGLGQLYQGRLTAATHFLLETATLITLLVAVPPLRPVAILALLGIAAWSVLDARRGG